MPPPRVIDLDLEDVELENSISPEDDLSELIASLNLSDLQPAKNPSGPAQRNGHNYRVREAGTATVIGPWYEAAARTQGVPGTAVKAFKASAPTTTAQRAPGGSSKQASETSTQRAAPSTSQAANAAGRAQGGPSSTGGPDDIGYTVYQGFIPGMYFNLPAKEAQVIGLNPSFYMKLPVWVLADKMRELYRKGRVVVRGSSIAEERHALLERQGYELVPAAKRCAVFRGFVPGLYTREEALEQVAFFDAPRWAEFATAFEAADRFREALQQGKVAALGDACAAERQQLFLAAANIPGGVPAPQPARVLEPRRSHPAADDDAADPDPALGRADPLHTGPWYAVFVGRAPGIYRSWPEAEEQVIHVSCAVHVSYATLTAARSAFRDARDQGRVRRHALPSRRRR
ncbi:hypothetical protein FA95DRAFT_1578321 [Auriscalpium vulgare]|uniref:Uncharacterized protein n=1 Tax=Auriscalpium vulgare TaxID=40419 RepID=A0ACB8R2E3_9AGAM|nr:hypothetical protein FA95DRAFT_1578321 [Auriscalpium vulgare]